MSKPRPRITRRDRMIMELIAEYGCVSGNRIRERFWSEGTNALVHFRRLRIITRLGLIEKVEGDGHQNLGFRLTKKGKRFLSLRKSQTPVVFLKRSYGTQFRHDQLMIGLRKIFELSPLVSDFKSEAQMLSEVFNGQKLKTSWQNATSVPDAAFSLKVPGIQQVRIAAELELSVKSRKRYERIFRNHLLSHRWQIVIYVCKDEKVKRRLMEWLTEIKAEDAAIRMAKSINGFYFSTIEDFQKLGLDAPLTNGKSEISLAKMDASR